MGLSLLQLARSIQSNRVSGIAQKLGITWPPPPAVSVRNLVLFGLRIVKHVFVLMLENRSFDHLLGFAGIGGTDAITGSPTHAEDLTRDGFFSNKDPRAGDILVNATSPADLTFANKAEDPGHEFENVVLQLCGYSRQANGEIVVPVYPDHDGNYPSINNGGFIGSYFGLIHVKDNRPETTHPDWIMKCFDPGQVPVITALAKEFVVFDHWFSSMPGPTWPNRFFAHAASSGGLDHSPSIADILQWETVAGFSFKNGTIFDKLSASKLEWRIYAGDDFPLVAGLKGIQLSQIHSYEDFGKDVADPGYSPSYTFIEPSYDILNAFKGGTSQHPLSDVTRGESLIKSTYEAIRNSPAWSSSLLIITWDEHGGFYDHVVPPSAAAPGDTGLPNSNNKNGFTFEQYGPRVCCVVASPLIPKNLVDHRIYDHASIPATIEACFGLSPMTHRDAQARSLGTLISFSTPRNDAIAALPSPAQSSFSGRDHVSDSIATALGQRPIAQPEVSVDAGNLPGVLHSALRYDLTLSPPQERDAILARFSALKTRADAQQYMDLVGAKIRAASRPSP